MNSEARQINQKFKLEIRRRQRQDILKRQRQKLYALQKIEQQKQLKSKTSNNPHNNLSQQIQINQITYTNVKQLYQIFVNKTNFMESISQSQLHNIMCMLLTKQSLQSIQGAHLIGSMIQYCGNQTIQTENKKKIILKLLTQSQIQKIIFQLALKSMNTLQNKQLKMYLHCIKNMALIRMQNILNKQLLQQYLPQMILNLISQQSFLIFLTYVSQTHVFSTHIIKLVCDQASSKQKHTKIYVLTILNNYINLQENNDNILNLFEKIIHTLSHLHICCKQYYQKYSLAALKSMTELISKFPDNMPKQLLKKVTHTKMQDLMIVMLSVSNQQTKYNVYEIEQTIIDKSIHELKEQFFNEFSYEIIQQFFRGIQQTNVNIIGKCLKIIVKLVYYAPKQLLQKIENQNQLSVVLEDLCFHRNQYIVSVAQQLREYFPQYAENQNDMNDL